MRERWRKLKLSTRSKQPESGYSSRSAQMNSTSTPAVEARTAALASPTSEMSMPVTLKPWVARKTLLRPSPQAISSARRPLSSLLTVSISRARNCDGPWPRKESSEAKRLFHLILSDSISQLREERSHLPQRHEGHKGNIKAIPAKPG